MSSNVKLLEDEVIQLKVTEVWEKVFAASNRVLVHARDYGFIGMEKIPVPNIHGILVHLQIVSSIIDILITNADKLNVSYDETRLMLNAKEQLTKMERLAAALKADKRDDFETALAALQQQAPF